MTCEKCNGPLKCEKCSETESMKKVDETENSEALNKLDEANAKLEKAEQTMSKMSETMEEMKQRIEKLEAEPVEGKAVLKATPVSKEEDSNLHKSDSISEDELAKLSKTDRTLVQSGISMQDLSKMDDNKKAFELTKIALKSPTFINKLG